MKTKAAILYSLNKPLVLETIEIPALKPGQVLVRVAYSGVCHSQLNEIKGRRGKDAFLPHTLGHEGSGVVCEVGPSVKKVKPGDHVVLTWIKGKGHDVPSSEYRKHGTIIHSGAISTFSSHSVISENRVVPISKTVPLEYAALLGCAMPTGGGIIQNTMKPAPASSIAIFGIGGVGMSALLATSLARCKPIIAIDIHDEKLASASRLGAHAVINAKKEDVLQQIQKITKGVGADFALESAGIKNTMEMAFRVIRPNGGLLVIAGNLAAGKTISLDPFDLIKGKRIVGSWGGNTNPDNDIPSYASQFSKKRLPLDKLITHRFALDDINETIRVLEKEKNVIRVMLDCRGNNE